MAPSTTKTMNTSSATTASQVSGSQSSVKDNMSIGSAESLAPRWVSPENGGGSGKDKRETINSTNLIHWIGILRDDVMLVEFCNEPNNPKIIQMSRRLLKNNTPKVDWEFKTYAVQSQRRMVHAMKFYIYDKIPLQPGARAKLVNLEQQTFLNGESVRIIEYQSSTNKYLIRPSIPLPEAQKLATTGMLVVHAKHLVAAEQEVRVWTIATLYDGKQLSQNSACQFVERILMITENFRTTDEWLLGKEMSCQDTYSNILQQQADQFTAEPISIDDSLEYSKQLIEQNIDIVSTQSTSLHQV